MTKPVVMLCAALGLALVGSWAACASAQSLQYNDPSYNFIFPAGGQLGQTVDVELGGLNGLAGATGLLIEGPAGITVSDVKAVSPYRTTARLTIAPDTLPGRRRVRIVGGTTGLTNCRSFFVGQLPEVLEVEPAAGADSQEVTTPVVINGRLDPTLDIDEYRFAGRAGQSLVAAVLAHRMDTLGRGRNNAGFLDTNLELLGPAGNVLASSEDALGLDPLIHCALPSDGLYTVRLQSLSFQGYPEAVYRLTLGEVPYPTALFPAGGRRGSSVDVEITGPNVPSGTRQTVTIPANEAFPIHDVPFSGRSAGNQDLPFLLSDFPEVLETAGNDAQATAQPLTLPVLVNGRFETPGDEDWSRCTLAKGEKIRIQTTADRHLFAPVDTVVEVFDAAGKLLAENDDGGPFACECEHDYASADSWLIFTAPTDGEFAILVRDQGQVGGPRAVYRLSVEPFAGDFQLYVWPDAVPIWGAGTTATCVVQLLNAGGLTGDVELRVEGLPAGWIGQANIIPAASIMPYPAVHYASKSLIAITAPADAPQGALAEFRIVGRTVQDGRTIEHTAQPLTLMGNSHNDRMHLRYSPQARAVVAGPLDSRLETSVQDVTIVQGASVDIPVRIHRQAGNKAQMGITVDGPTIFAGCSWQAPLALGPEQDEVRLPFKVDATRPVGTYGVVVSRSWASDLRNGRPGPCTPMIRVHVVAPAK